MWLNDWRKSQLRFGPSGLTVTLDRNPASARGYSSGEIQSRASYQYGYYATRLIAARGTGVITGFFTYTGPSRGKIWNEVDIEFLGKDTRAVQVTYHVGNQQKATRIPLPFDAAAESHTYSFDWQSGLIKWYVDDKEVHSESTASGRPLPTEPQQIMFDLWNTNSMPAWAGPYNWPGHPVTAQVRCIAHTVRFVADLCR